MTELLDPRQVADLLGVTVQRLANWRYRGRGPNYIKLGYRSIRYQRADVEQWLAEHTIRAEDHPKVLP
jgi:predicted DNA-binding transcriptional regulator AlpA